MRQKKKRQAIADLLLVLGSIALAVLIAYTGVVHEAARHLQGWSYYGMFIAGMFFTSAFTTAPAIVMLGELAQNGSALDVAFWGGLGAVLGDYLLFRFIRDRVADDVRFVLGHSKWLRLPAIFKTGLFRYTLPLLGALIIASPFPDELGLTLLGLSKTGNKFFLPISFTFNAAGILLIGWAATAVGW